MKRDGSKINVTDSSLAQYDAFADALRRLSAASRHSLERENHQTASGRVEF